MCDRPPQSYKIIQEATRIHEKCCRKSAYLLHELVTELQYVSADIGSTAHVLVCTVVLLMTGQIISRLRLYMVA